MRASFFQKFIFAFIIVSLALSPLTGNGNPFVKKAKASLGAVAGRAVAAGAACFLEARLESFIKEIDPLSIGQAMIETVKHPWAVPTAAVNAPPGIDSSQSLLKSKDCIRDVIAKAILDELVDETVQWIQGGGKPKFVTDWKFFLRDAANAAGGQVLSEIGLAGVCQPFNLQVRLSLSPPQRFPQQLQCTLTDVVQNINNFYKNFSNGGWLAYNEMWMEPNNNYYGATLMGYNEMLARAEEARQAAQNEALAGKGFLSVKTCVEYDNDYIKQCEAAGGTDCKNVSAACNKYEIQTPGDVVGAAAAKAITSDYDWAQNIKSWMAALVNAVINRLIKEGLGAMKGNNESQPAGGGGNFDPYHQSGAAQQTSQNDISDIISQYQQILNDRQAILDLKNQSLSDSQELLTDLQQLQSQNCQPPVSNTEITQVQSDITRLNTEINNLSAFIVQVNNLINEANSITNPTADDVASLQTEYTNFVNQNNSVISEVYSGSGKTAAQTEAATIQSNLSDARTRLANCSQSQTNP